MFAGPFQVEAVATGEDHGFSKQIRAKIRLVEGIGVEGDAHAGASVQHRSRIRPSEFQPNLRQVHLIGIELLSALALDGFDVPPGGLGENITTRGLDLLALPRGAVLAFSSGAEVQITGLRNPCQQIEAYRAGLLGRVARRRSDGSIERLAGVMGIVIAGGEVQPGDAIRVRLPAQPFEALDRV
jgi:hypothetical protein